MGSDFSEATATDAVVDSFAATPDPRLREVMESFTRHLHGFVREVEPTQGEWEAAIGFLTEVGHLSDDRRQEFILLSDVMGVSMLVDAINNRRPVGATESTVLGPFHVVESPVRALGDDLAETHDAPALPGPRPGPRPRRPTAGPVRSSTSGRPTTRGSTTCRRTTWPRPARPVHDRRRRPLLVPDDRAAALPDPRRRSRRRAAAAPPDDTPTGLPTSTSSRARPGTAR